MRKTGLGALPLATAILVAVVAIGATAGAAKMADVVGIRCALAPATTFDAASWRSADGFVPCSARAGMADAVLSENLKRGMTRGDVLAVLGEPDDTDGRWEEWDLAYAVGCFIDCNWVLIDFDETGRLIRASRLQD